MAKQYRQNTSYGEILADGSENSESDEGTSANHGNTRLPFGLCERYGIKLPNSATPRDAWNALKGKGITPEQVYAELEKDNSKDKQNADDNYNLDTREAGRIVFESRDDALRYAEQNLGMHLEQSLSHLPDEVVKVNVEQLSFLDGKFNCIDKTAKIWFSASNRGKDTLAYATVRQSNATIAGLNLCQSHYGNYDALIATELEMRDAGKPVDFADDFAPKATVTHEYGHILFEKLLSESDYVDKINEEKQLANRRSHNGYASAETVKKIVKKVRLQKSKEMFQELTEIAQSIEPGVNMFQQMSSYGRTDYEEYFAEAFLNSQGGRPNTVGKAMQIFLDRRFK